MKLNWCGGTHSGWRPMRGNKAALAIQEDDSEPLRVFATNDEVVEGPTLANVQVPQPMARTKTTPQVL